MCFTKSRQKIEKRDEIRNISRGNPQSIPVGCFKCGCRYALDTQESVCKDRNYETRLFQDQKSM